MSPGETVSRSPLDKPLHQLTEDDISQLTREDCRRFLREKGMRRPSWNKSQAIQQVISLKALLEPTPDYDAGDSAEAQKDLIIPHFTALSLPAPEKGTRSDSWMPQDSPKLPASGDHVPTTRTELSSPRITGAMNGPAGQMTIFYSGKVNVYDDVACDKARTIMQLAANPLHISQEAPSENIAALCPYPFHSPSTSVKVGPNTSVKILPTLQTANVTKSSQLHKEVDNTSRDDNLEGLSSRKASVQRYLEKRKDRFKRKVPMPSSTSSDIYLTHRVGDRISNEQSGRSDACCPLQPALQQTPTHSCPAENITRSSDLSANYKGIDLNLIL